MISTEQKTWIALGLVAVLTLASTGAAMHYRSRANLFQTQYREALAEAEALREQQRPATAVTPPARTVEINARTPQAEVDNELAERVQELERALADREDQLRLARLQQRYNPPQPEAEPETPPRERRDWMAELQENDPERYEEIMRRREEMRQRVQDSFARRAAHFLHRDLSNMPPEERAEYEHMLGLLAETWELSDRIQTPDVSREERTEIRRTLGQNMRELRPLLANERDREFYELGRQLGYDSESAAQFVDYLNDMIDITSLSPFGGGRGGGMMGGGGRPRGPQ